MSRRQYASLREFFEAHPGLSQADVANDVGVTPSAMSRYANGDRIPQPAIALKLSRRTGVSLESLLDPQQEAKSA